MEGEATVASAAPVTECTVEHSGQGNAPVTNPLSSIPARSWKMDDTPKTWLCAGHSPEEQASLLKRVADAEAQQKRSRFISVP
jgi:hypothetical protein